MTLAQTDDFLFSPLNAKEMLKIQILRFLEEAIAHHYVFFSALDLLHQLLKTD